MPVSRRPNKARVTIDNEVWEATVGSPLRLVGRYVRKPRQGTVFESRSETSSATVLGIDEGSKTIYTDGKGQGWDRVAQVHKLEVVEYLEN